MHPLMEGRVGLREMIRLVQDELAAAQEQRISQGKPPLFVPAELHLELEFVVAEEAEGRGEVKFWVVTAGARGKIASSRAHRMKLTLKVPEAVQAAASRYVTEHITRVVTETPVGKLSQPHPKPSTSTYGPTAPYTLEEIVAIDVPEGTLPHVSPIGQPPPGTKGGGRRR